MAHRGETLDKNVSCIADLKALGSRRLPVMVRGEMTPHRLQTSNADGADYYNGGAMDLVTYDI